MLPAAKPQYVQGWFLSDPKGPHPEHPIVIPPQPGEPPINPGTPGYPTHPISGLPGYPGGPPVDPGYGKPFPPDAHPEHPIVIPPLVGIWPSPGHPAHPIVLPPETPGQPPSGPIYIEGTPENPISTEPGTLQPPLPQGVLPNSKVAVLVKVVGVEGERWLTVDNTPTVNPLGK